LPLQQKRALYRLSTLRDENHGILVSVGFLNSDHYSENHFAEPDRVTFQPHENGIFDVKWDRVDAHIVTCSGDHSSRITSVERRVTTHVLHGHTSTVKTTCWDPTNDALLATGGRDGLICLWDLRTSTTTMEDVSVMEPVIVIPNAHGDPTKPTRRTKKTDVPVPKTVTSIIYPDSQPYGLVSSGAANGCA